jgi:hypothetical protein
MKMPSSLKSIDFQQFASTAAQLQQEALMAGIESWQLWIDQAARFSSIASETLKSIQDDKGSLSATVRQLGEFGKESAEAYGTLSSRLTKTYFDGCGQLAAAITANKDAAPAGRSSVAARGGKPGKRAPRRAKSRLAKRK